MESSSLISDVICLIAFFVPSHLPLRLVSKRWDSCIQSMHASPNGCSSCYAVAKTGHSIIHRRNRLFFMAQWKLILPYSCPPPSSSELGFFASFKTILSSLFYSSSAAALQPPPYLVPLRQVLIPHQLTTQEQIYYLTEVINASDLGHFISKVSIRGQCLTSDSSLHLLRTITSLTQMRTLRDLSLDCLHLTTTQVRSFFTELPLLSSACFHGCGLTNAHISSICSTSLTSLTVHHEPFSPETIATIVTPNLKHFCISYLSPHRQTVLHSLQAIAASKSTSFMRLQSLEFPYATVDVAIVGILSSSASVCPNLERIKCSGMTDDAFLSIVSGASPLARLRSLETAIHGNSIKDLYETQYKPELRAVLHLSSLVLRITESPLRGDNVATLLSSLPSSCYLTKLAIDSMSDAGLAAIFNQDTSTIRNLKSFSWSSSYMFEESDGMLATKVGIESLCSSPLAANLTRLSVGAYQPLLIPMCDEDDMESWRPKTFMNDECSALIASSAHLRKLRCLKLHGNNLSLSKGLIGLLESPYLLQLSELDVGIFQRKDLMRIPTHTQDESMEAAECAQRIAEALRNRRRECGDVLNELRIPNGDYHDTVLSLLKPEFPFMYQDLVQTPCLL